jgi:hypothetical protein
VDELKMKRLKSELATFFFNDRSSPQDRQRINKKISQGRKLIAKRYLSLFTGHGTIAPRFNNELKAHGIESEWRHFGGTRVILRAKYKKHAFPPLDLSPETQCKEAMRGFSLRRLQAAVDRRSDGDDSE